MIKTWSRFNFVRSSPMVSLFRKYSNSTQSSRWTPQKSPTIRARNLQISRCNTSHPSGAADASPAGLRLLDRFGGSFDDRAHLQVAGIKIRIQRCNFGGASFVAQKQTGNFREIVVGRNSSIVGGQRWINWLGSGWLCTASSASGQSATLWDRPQDSAIFHRASWLAKPIFGDGDEEVTVLDSRPRWKPPAWFATGATVGLGSSWVRQEHRVQIVHHQTLHLWMVWLQRWLDCLHLEHWSRIQCSRWGCDREDQRPKRAVHSAFLSGRIQRLRWIRVVSKSDPRASPVGAGEGATGRLNSNSDPQEG